MRTRKLLALLLALLMVTSLALTACGGDEDVDSGTGSDITDNNGNDATNGEDEIKYADEQVLNYCFNADPPCLDPQLSTDTTSSTIMNDTLEGIIRMDHDGTAKEGSGMATSWDVSDDALTYTFHLRDANWTDGVPVTAYDFEYSWIRALDPATASQYAFLVYPIVNAQEFNSGEITDPSEVGIKALDEKTIQVTLKQQDPVFVSKLQHSTFFPSRKDLVEKYGDSYGQDFDKTEYCGPFKVVEWVHEQNLRLVKNEGYWDKDVVKIEEINIVINSDTNTRINLYETGEIDSVSIAPQFIDTYRDQLKILIKAGTRFFSYNTKNEFLASEKIRNAIARGWDRELYNETRYKGTRPSAYAFVPPGMPGAPIATYFRDANGMELFTDMHHGAAVKDEVLKLLEEGLAEVGKTKADIDGALAYSCTDSDAALQDAQIYQQMWKENLGFEIGIEQATWRVHLDKMHTGEFTMGYMGWVGDYNDPMTFMDLYITESSFNDPGWSNAEFDALIEKANTTVDAKERMQAMLDAEKILMKELPISPYSYIADPYVQRDYVQNIVRLPILVDSGKKWAYVLEH